VPRASYYCDRRKISSPAMTASRSSPARALHPVEREAVLSRLHEERFQDRSPAAVYATLLDEGEYHCSIRTMYRLLEQHGESRERRDQLLHPPYQKPELLATAPNQLWSWDISKLLGPAKWTYFYLYVIPDVFSRYVTGWMVAYRESAELAKRLIEESCKKQRIPPAQLTLHADRGTSMRSKPVALLLADLGVTKTHSRPHVSDDNPYSESQFRTMKYRPEFPDRFRVHSGQSYFLPEFFSVVQPRASSLRGRLVDASDGSLWSSGKHPAATPGCARCCLPTPPGALRTKRSQTTGPSLRSLD
jgi:putative transposase